MPPAASGRSLSVRAFGAKGDGRSDDTAALRRALAALKPGDALHFGPGLYTHRARLPIITPRVHLLGDGATLHASNAADQALLIQADGVVVRGFTLTAATDRRRDAPWESRIAVWREGSQPLQGIHVLDNRIIEAGPAGTSLANSSSSAAIFIHHARGFVVADNLVRRSLADAIHVTGGSSHGHVLRNTVRESGDDMVAVVSYLPSSVAEQGRTLVSHVLIANNDLSGQYWGRGISVVGGEDITIVDNRVDATTHAAGIYIAREAVYRTHGVRRVRVGGNTITRVQTVAAAYSALEPARRGKRTGHGAVELVAQMAPDDQPDTDGGRALGVQDVLIDHNVIDDVTDGVRVGDGWQQTRRAERQRGGGGVEPISLTGGPVRRITLRNNRIGAVQGQALVVFNASDAGLSLVCEGNLHQGTPLGHAACTGAPSAVAAAAALPNCTR